MFRKITSTYNEFPRTYWVVAGTHFIDVIGNTLLMPFFALYVTQKFDVGMTQAGILLATNSAAGLVGSTIGGAMADRFGRRGIILFGLIVSALSGLTLGFVDKFYMFYGLSIFVGLMGSAAHPAHQAMIADILPPEKRAEGYGLMRVISNFAWIIGPTIGGFLAAYNFLYLFLSDALISSITALLVFRLLPETKPQPKEKTEHESLWQTLSGYRVAIFDFPYLAFIFASILMILVYQQMYSSLSVYLRDVHQVDPQFYGLIMSSSAVTVVIFQFAVTRIIKRYPPFLMMAAATFFYMIGFTMYGFVATIPLFIVAMVIITIGEMIGMPTSNVLAASFAPEEMRARYMAVFGLVWAVPSMIGPWAAGLIFDNYDPNYVWYIGGVLCVVAIIAFYSLHIKLGAREKFQRVEEI
ncbi:MAG: MFS transporter [Anaerolineales bacterium]|nr:MFS transporter [Anaerolineales bacterium]MBK8822758.1 MFS transporter [Anaerolineales bacterium]